MEQEERHQGEDHHDHQEHEEGGGGEPGGVRDGYEGPIDTLGIATDPLCQCHYRWHKPAHPLPYQVRVEIDLLEDGHVGQEEDGGRAVHQGEEEDCHKQPC